MKKMIHKVADDAEALGCAGLITVCRQLAGLEAMQCASLFRIEVGTITVEP
jgi:hypothetical protein